MTESGPGGIPQNKKETEAGKIPHGAEILDGKEAKDLLDSMQRYTLESGDLVLAGTDKGIGYKDHNEDRIASVPGKNFLAVVDGIGGMGKGDEAAQILAEELLANPDDIQSAVLIAKTRMEEAKIGVGGAVFVATKLVQEPSGKSVEFSQCGDSKMMIIKKDGSVKFESRENTMAQTLVENKAMTADQALYYKSRNIIMDAISSNPELIGEVEYNSRISVEVGDMVLLMSDGISDNFTAEEIAEVISGPPRMTVEELYEWLYYATGQRMSNKKEIIASSDRENDGKYSDGYKTQPKADNRALVIMEIK